MSNHTLAEIHDPRLWSIDHAKMISRSYLESFPILRQVAAMHHGTHWYGETRLLAEDMTTGHRDLSFFQSIGVIAALSIRSQWRENEIRALNFANGGLPVGVPLAREKCNQLAELPTDHDFEDVLGVLNGPKISAFAECIYSPIGARTVPFDVYMLSIYELAARQSKWRSKTEDGLGVLDVLTLGLCDLADDIGIPVPTLQATLWTLQRGSHDGAFHPSKVRDGQIVN
jgi:hypothetical protein